MNASIYSTILRPRQERPCLQRRLFKGPIWPSSSCTPPHETDSSGPRATVYSEPMQPLLKHTPGTQDPSNLVHASSLPKWATPLFASGIGEKTGQGDHPLVWKALPGAEWSLHRTPRSWIILHLNLTRQVVIKIYLALSILTFFSLVSET